MKDNTHKLINRETDQTGRPSYLAQYREYWCPKDRIEPLLVAPVNLSDWFPLFGGYIVRAFRTGEPTDKFDLPEPAPSTSSSALQISPPVAMSKWLRTR